MKKNKKEVISSNIKKNLFWNAFGSFTYLFCQWLLTLIVVRLSSDLHDPGNFALAMTVSNVFFNLACFNVRPFMVSDTKKEYDVEDYLAFRIITCSIAILICFLYTLVFNYTRMQLACIMLFLLFKIGEAVTDLFHGLEQRKDRMDIGGISLFSRGIISLLVFSISYYLFNNLALSLLLIVVASYIFVIAYDYPIILKFEKLKIHINSSKVKKLFLYLFPLAIGTFLGTFTTSLPRQILEKLCGIDSLGIYATIATPAVIIQMAATYIYNPFLLSFANHNKENDMDKFVKLFLKITLFIVLLSVAGIIGSILFARILLLILYGEKIAKYSYLFLLIAVLTSLTGYMWFCHNILIVLRKIKSILLINVSGFAITVLLSSTFIKLFDMNGVSIVLILSTCVMIIEMLIVIIREIQKKYNKL